MHIGFVTHDPRSHYWLLVSYGVRERARELGIAVTLEPATTLEQQIALITMFIDRRVDVLLLGPLAAQGLADSIASARAAGIPVIVLAAQLTDCTVDCTVRSDHRTGAELAAAYMVTQINERGAVAHLVGPRRLQDSRDRAAGVQHVLAQHPGVQLVFEQESPDWAPESGAAFMQAALARCPQLRGVCVANDTLALGAISAIAGHPDPIVVTGFDATPDALIAIHEGRLSATVRQSMGAIGRSAVELAAQLVQGAAVPRLVLTPISLVTRDTLLETMLDAVYLLPSVLSDVVERSEALTQAHAAEAARDQQRAERALEESDDRFRRLAEAAFEGIIIHDQGRIVDANRAAVVLFGYERQELLGRQVTELIPRAGAAWLAARSAEQPYEALVRRKDGTTLAVDVRDKALLSSGQALRISAVQDITERKRAEAERDRLHADVQRALTRTDVLYRTAQALSTAADLPQLGHTVVAHTARALPTALITLSVVDPQTREVLQVDRSGPGSDAGTDAHDAVLWGSLRGWVLQEAHAAHSSTTHPDPHDDPDDRRRRAAADSDALMIVPLPYQGRVLGTLTALHRRAQPDFTGDDLALLEALASQAATAIANLRLMQDVQRLAVTDELTQLLNRRGFFTFSAHEMRRARRQVEVISALMLDIDAFKRINDQYGHATGDQVLQTVAERVRRAVRETDVVGRYGGEEFAVLLPATTSSAAEGVAERVRVQVARTPVAAIPGALAVTVSLGVATVADGASDLEALLQWADAALYVAKQAGRNRVVVHAATSG